MVPPVNPFSANPFHDGDYDPEPGREKIRGRIALIALTTFFALVAFYLYETNTASAESWSRLKEAMQSVLSAVTSVVGTVLGFYFGSQKR